MANTTSSENNVFPHSHTNIEALISPSTLPQTTSLRAMYGLSSLANYIKIKDEPTETGSPPARAPRKVAVGILGAGAAGLYTAMIINSFNDPNLSCEILESNLGCEAVPPRRGGGRLYTYHFDGGKKYDYFDLGAMRFPETPFMKSMMWLLKDPASPIHDKIKTIPYILNSDNNLSMFNGITMTQKEINDDPSPDPFKTGVMPPASVSSCLENALGTFRKGIKDDFQKGWKALMKMDAWSTRQYMRTCHEGPGFTAQVTDWLETFDTGTGLYDRALTEAVLDSLDFNYGDGVKWHCVDGGAGCIADAMASTLHEGQIRRGKKVTKIAIKKLSDKATVNVFVNNEPAPQSFDHVVTTMPFGCLRMVDMTECSLTWELQTAIRCLSYDSSVKIGVRFSERWWEKQVIPHYGGVSNTDRPTRVLVYPSYGMKEDKGATMIVSYTWAQDALRFGACAQGKDSPPEKELLEIVLNDLADIHGIQEKDYLPGLLLEYKIHDWYADADSCGAFAMFGPGQFQSLYKHVTIPAAHALHFAGEATSVHHAWVEGALSSAFRSVAEILYIEGRQELFDKLLQDWPVPDEFNVNVLRSLITIGGKWPKPQ